MLLQVANLAWGTTWNVPTDVATISEATALASSGDRILLEPGTYTDTIAVAFDLAIEGGDGVIWQGTGAELLTVSGGAQLTVSDVVFDGASASRMIRATDASLVLDRCSVINGAVGDSGGGILSTGGDLTLRDCRFESNTAQTGAHVYLDGTSLVIERGSFVSGSAAADGGAIAVTSASAVSITGTTFRDNWAGNNAGALWLAGSTASTIQRSMFCRNIAGDSGGALLLTDTATLDVSSSMFLENVASTGSGGAAFESSQALLSTTNNHFVGNTTVGEGAAIFADGLGSHRNVLVAYNVFTGANTSVHSIWNQNAIVIDYALFWGNETWDTNAPYPAHYDRADPLFTAWPPVNCDPTALVPALGSPAIDEGDPSMFDLDGSIVDIGAFGGLDPFLFDLDGDGFDSGIDCDDTTPQTHPGATEIPADGIDTDCDGLELCWSDPDGDGLGTEPLIESDDLECIDAGEADNDDDPGTPNDPTTTETPETTDTDAPLADTAGDTPATEPQTDDDPLEPDAPELQEAGGAGKPPEPPYGCGCRSAQMGSSVWIVSLWALSLRRKSFADR